MRSSRMFHRTSVYGGYTCCEIVNNRGNEGNVIMVAYGKCKCGLTPYDRAQDRQMWKQHADVFAQPRDTMAAQLL